MADFLNIKNFYWVVEFTDRQEAYRNFPLVIFLSPNSNGKLISQREKLHSFSTRIRMSLRRYVKAYYLNFK